MLPHQYYSGVLNYDEYQDWLKSPIDRKLQNPSVNVHNHFSSILHDHNDAKIDPPIVQPAHLLPIYVDEHIIVVNKPSGVMSVPGPRRHECVASLAYRYFGKSDVDCDQSEIFDQDSRHPNEKLEPWNVLTDADNKQIDTMIVHRLDRDTSGVLVLARNNNALKKLHKDFKDKTTQKVSKRYIALVCGHLHKPNEDMGNFFAVDEGEIDLPLVRDLDHPPFMCVATEATTERQRQLKRQSSQQNKHNHSGYLRMVGKGAKESLTMFRILSYEYLGGTKNENDERHCSERPLLPVTRVELTPVTGRTHQLRVHCAAMGHPIVGDSIYGYNGEGSAYGGLDLQIDKSSVCLERDIYKYWMECHKRNDKTEPWQTAFQYKNDDCMLCLHAYQMSIFHPLTKSPMLFECTAPF